MDLTAFHLLEPTLHTVHATIQLPGVNIQIQHAKRRSLSVLRAIGEEESKGWRSVNVRQASLKGLIALLTKPLTETDYHECPSAFLSQFSLSKHLSFSGLGFERKFLTYDLNYVFVHLDLLSRKRTHCYLRRETLWRKLSRFGSPVPSYCSYEGFRRVGLSRIT